MFTQNFEINRNLKKRYLKLTELSLSSLGLISDLARYFNVNENVLLCCAKNIFHINKIFVRESRLVSLF